LKEDFPDRDIQVLDSKQCAMGQGFLVMEAAKLRDQGFSLSETVRVLTRACAQYRLMITVDSLEYLQRGGRIGLVSAFAGTLLNIKPIIYMSEGELHPLSMARGRVKAIQALVKAMRADIGQSADKYHMGVLHADCADDLALLQEECVKQGFVIDLPVFVIGVTIGAHIGPTALAVGYFPKTELFI
jgi:DegV family protein with EDD domain